MGQLPAVCDDLTITGPGASVLTLDGSGHRVIETLGGTRVTCPA